MKKALISGCVAWFLFGVFMACGSEEEKDHWKRTLQAVADYQLLKTSLASPDAVVDLDQEQAAALLKASGSFKVLESPNCRCLPTVQHYVVFFLSDGNVLTVQVTKNHWFNAVFLYRGQVKTFILLDEKNQFCSAVEKIVNPPEEKRDPMCEECAGKMHIMSIGTCQSCGGSTSSMSFKFCPDCARQKGVCQACGKPLK